MNFIHIGFLAAGAAAMSLPIWIHLLLRQRAKLMQIGSIRFVKQVVRRTKSRQRIQRWLLLTLRAVAVLLLGLLFARPFLPDTPADGRTREVAVLIDRSASMSVRNDAGTTGLESACQRAAELIGALGEQARVHIGLFDSSGVETISLAELSGAKPASTGTRFDDALDWAADRLAVSDRADRSLFVLSDLQRPGAQQSSRSNFPADIPVRIEDRSPVVNQNLSIESVVPTQVELRPAIPVAISIRLYNSGVFPVTNVPVVVRLMGKSGAIVTSQSVSLAAAQRQAVGVPLDVNEPGMYQGTVSIDRDDPYPWDNTRYVAFEVRYPDRLLLIDGDASDKLWENETYFLETALRLQTPVGQGPARTFQIERLVWDRGSGFPDLASFRLIVLANLGRFTTNDADRLKAFVRDGGNVLWFSGERTTSAVLDPILRSGLMGETQVLPAVDAIARVVDFDSKNPALAPLADPQHGDLRGLSVRRLVPIQTLAPESEVLLASRRWPLIVSRATGKGRFVFVATSADRSWSDWPQNRLFVPLIRQLAAWLTGQLDVRKSVLSETISNPRHSPGIIAVEDSVVVRNVDPSESDIGRFSEEQFREAVGLPREEKTDAVSEAEAKYALAGTARSDEKWPLIVWALLAVLAVELLLASRVHE